MKKLLKIYEIETHYNSGARDIGITKKADEFFPLIEGGQWHDPSLVLHGKILINDEEGHFLGYTDQGFFLVGIFDNQNQFGFYRLSNSEETPPAAFVGANVGVSKPNHFYWFFPDICGRGIFPQGKAEVSLKEIEPSLLLIHEIWSNFNKIRWHDINQRLVWQTDALQDAL